ncbi:LamG-like jellyroll fold domain-containing protein [Niabella beijingensis]|uniref:LamG-like jellyroll fold domain-containing protein n=1 Tax=Niabella beijingensis TaxID=2872700 RepID=UPI001CBEFACD|nr:LamG-like jellyroll fold domain-containing protein [Niabella beijingensis]MBZ4189075.1 DUF4983 domain-containing protein [Niabella beijingensis]
MYKFFKTSGLFAGMAMLLVAVITFSCNKPFKDTLGNNVTGKDTVKTGYKVLYVIMDGARGEAFGASERPVLRGMEENGVYTTSGLGDYERKDSSFTNENAWANMFTGVSQTKHLVKGTSFAGSALDQYPSFVSRLKALRPDIRTAAFVSSVALKDHLLSGAAVAQTLSDDAAIQTAALAELKNPAADVVIAQYTGIQKAGDQFGYDNNVPEYQSAILKMDTYIGALRDAVVSRPGFSHENWLIIVASSDGGLITTLPSDITAYGDARRNTYVLFYNPRFSTRLVEKPANTRGSGAYAGNAVRLYGNPNTATGGGGTNVIVQNKAGETNQSVLDPGQGPYTMEARIKLNPRSDGTYNYSNSGGMPFLSKARYRYNGDYSGVNSGWSIFRNGTNTTLWFRSDGAVSGTRVNTEFNTSTAINDGIWHSLAFTISKNGTNITINAYVDGLASGTQQLSLASAGDGISSTAPLTLGYNDNIFGGTSYMDMSIADVRIWKATLPADVIYQYSCLPGRPPVGHPFFSSLVGFWEGASGSGTDNTILDETGNGRNALVNANNGGSIQWKPFSQTSNNICPAPDEAYFERVPNTKDIPLQILRWVGINSVTAPQLDGRIWLSSFDNL